MYAAITTAVSIYEELKPSLCCVITVAIALSVSDCIHFAILVLAAHVFFYDHSDYQLLLRCKTSCLMFV